MKNNELKKINQDPELENPFAPLICEVKNDLDQGITVVENYTQNEFDAQIEEYNTLMHIEDMSPDFAIDVDDLSFELKDELKQKINQIKPYPESPNDHNYYEYHLLNLWKNILEDLGDFLSSRQLFAIAYCIGTYAEVCTNTYERRKEIIRNIGYYEDWFVSNHISCDELESKIFAIDTLIFYELTEILLYSEVVYQCRMDPGKSDHYPLLENNFLLQPSSNQRNNIKNFI